eukprot:gene22378-47939_t
MLNGSGKTTLCREVHRALGVQNEQTAIVQMEIPHWLSHPGLITIGTSPRDMPISISLDDL